MSKQSEIREEIANKKNTLSLISNRLSSKQLKEFKVKTNREITELEDELESLKYSDLMQNRSGIDETRCYR